MNKLRRRLPLSLLLVAVTVPVVAGCGGGGSGSTPTTMSSASSSAPAQSSAKVDISDFAYDPDPVTVMAGGKITWTNSDTAEHTATADDGTFDTGALQKGDSKTVTLKKPGTYTYVCSFHAFMHGTVVVK